jgi:hypothetical protein
MNRRRPDAGDDLPSTIDPADCVGYQCRTFVQAQMGILGGASPDDYAVHTTLQHELDNAFEGIQICVSALVNGRHQGSENTGRGMGWHEPLSIVGLL